MQRGFSHLVHRGSPQGPPLPASGQGAARAPMRGAARQCVCFQLLSAACVWMPCEFSPPPQSLAKLLFRQSDSPFHLLLGWEPEICDACAWPGRRGAHGIPGVPATSAQQGRRGGGRAETSGLFFKSLSFLDQYQKLTFQSAGVLTQQMGCLTFPWLSGGGNAFGKCPKAMKIFPTRYSALGKWREALQGWFSPIPSSPAR